MCVLSCTDTNDNTRNWRIVPFAKWATGNYPAPIWNSTTKSYDYPE
ncbi:MAG: hypothetical protein LBQ24_01190 [Candidatus Peribacteria bacterium]|nr:hypothetical protein [Candidatus Peribacteria bacterium]